MYGLVKMLYGSDCWIFGKTIVIIHTSCSSLNGNSDCGVYWNKHCAPNNPPFLDLGGVDGNSSELLHILFCLFKQKIFCLCCDIMSIHTQICFDYVLVNGILFNFKYSVIIYVVLISLLCYLMFYAETNIFVSGFMCIFTNTPRITCYLTCDWITQSHV